MVNLGFCLTSIIAGILTVLSPCVLPLLPVIIGGIDAKKSFWRPLAIIVSLGVSVLVFTLLLKASTVLIGIPVQVWQSISGVIVLLFGVFTLKPQYWDYLATKSKLKTKSQRALGSNLARQGLVGYCSVGFSLGLVFSSCSPTYGLIVAVILPAQFGVGLVYLLCYILGLMLVLGLVAVLGQNLISRLSFINRLKTGIGILLIVVGVAIMTGYDKKFEAWLIDQGVYDSIVDIEGNLPDHDN